MIVAFICKHLGMVDAIAREHPDMLTREGRGMLGDFHDYFGVSNENF